MKTLALAVTTALLLAQAAHAADAPATFTTSDKTTSDKDYVILKVGDDGILKSEVEATWKSIFPGANPPPFDTFDPKIRDNVLRGVASEHMLLKEAEKAGVDKDSDVQARIQAAKNQILIREFLKEKTKDLVSDDKLKAAYEEKVRNMAGSGQEEVKARHILVKTEAEAKVVEKKLKKGADFAKLAKEQSEDKGSGGAGGELGWFTPDKMVPAFSKAAFVLKKGEVSDPVKSEFGWHVIQVEDRRHANPPPFEQMRDSLVQELGSKAVQNYVNGLMKDVKLTEMDSTGKTQNLTPMPPAPDAPAGK